MSHVANTCRNIESNNNNLNVESSRDTCRGSMETEFVALYF